MNSSLAAVAETDFQPFTDLAAGRQRKVLSVRNLSKAYQAQHKVLDGISFDLHAGEMVGVNRRSCMSSTAPTAPAAEKFLATRKSVPRTMSHS
ncbi:phosphonate transport ATP-binding protein [Klebsiella pneumoniae]|nr:phosphonate transport ATP-binding protein [Klebsiella pneumoniae]